MSASQLDVGATLPLRSRFETCLLRTSIRASGDFEQANELQILFSQRNLVDTIITASSIPEDANRT